MISPVQAVLAAYDFGRTIINIQSADRESIGWDTGARLGDLFKSFVAPAIIAVFFTGMTNHFLERLKGRREAVTGLSIELRDEMFGLQELGSEYWSGPAGRNDALKEAKIMAGLEAISTGLRAFERDRKASLSKDLDAWLAELRDQLTGGGFQTSNRTADFPRLQAVASHLTKMRYKVFDERLKKI